MTVFINNMLSLESVADVKAMLDELHISYTTVDLGEVDFGEKITRDNLKRFKSVLADAGMDILESRKMILIERIKALIIKMIRYSDDLPAENYSSFISASLQHNYTYLANLFSASERITIEHFIIMHKIEKVKELLLSDTYNLTEISQKMHYSSVAHLSNQFKKATGLTTTYFKNNPDGRQ